VDRVQVKFKHRGKEIVDFQEKKSKPQFAKKIVASVFIGMESRDNFGRGLHSYAGAGAKTG
jgi:hypothetical protein